MAAIQVKVSPGEVISSELFNRMIDMLNAHEALLGGNAPIAITSVMPPALHVGDSLQVLGNGLSAANVQEIRVDSSNVPVGSIKPGSNDTVMLIDIPAMLVPPAGKSATLLVRNKGGASATAQVYVLPQAVADLDATFNFVRTQVTPGGNLAASTTYEFTFSIETFSTLDETYLLEPRILNVPAGWSAVMKGGATELFIPKSQPTPTTNSVVVVVTTGTTGGGDLSLGVRAKNHATVVRSSMPESIALGSTPGAPNLDVEFLSPTVLGSIQKFANGSLYIRTDANTANQRATINPLQVRLKTGGQYTVGTPVASDAKWSVTVASNPNINTTGTPNAIVPIILNFSAQAGAPDANVQVPVTGSGALPSGTFSCQLKLRADPSNPNPL